METNKPIPIDLILVVDHLRNCSRDSVKTELAAEIGVEYAALAYFARSGNSAPSPALLTALAKKFLPDYVIAPAHLVREKACPILPTGWRVHPDNAKYAYKGQEVKLISELVGKVSAA